MSIFLVPSDGRNVVRTIDFEIDKINVITGGSAKGKSALISIVDYCLCSSGCKIPIGKIRNQVAWFGLHLYLGESREMIIARKTPGESGVSGEMYLSEGINLVRPSIFLSNMHVSQVKSRLDSIANLPDIGIGDSSSGYDSRPSFRDFISFVFQSQNIIANQNELFYRVDSPTHRQKLIGIFAYVLQAVDNLYLENREKIRLLEKNIAELVKQLEKEKSYVKKFIGRVRGYYSQAIEFSLIANDLEKSIDNIDLDIILNRLEEMSENVNANDFLLVSSDAVEDSTKRLSELITRETNLAHELQLLKYRLNSIGNLIEANYNYREGLLKQYSRVKSLDWFKKILEREEHCPLCGAENTTASDYVRSLIKTSNDIVAKGTQLNDNTTVLASEHRKVSLSIKEKANEINQTREEIKILNSSTSKNGNVIHSIFSVYKFIGAISAEISSFREIIDTSVIEASISDLSFEKQLLEKTVDDIQVENRMLASKKFIIDAVSFYASIFRAENFHELLTFSEKDLTLKFLTKEGYRYSLFEIGSGANFMAYHISNILAFHEFFLSRVDHPAPNFLFLDQPTQVYFPDNDNEIVARDEDVENVRKIFEVLDTAIKRLKGKLQIIVLEHVGEYAWEGFENIIKIKRWRGDEANSDDRALIPDSWLV